jgi:hypothetical protein
MHADILNFSTPAKVSQSRKEPIKRSSWIESVRYHQGFLVAFTKGKQGKSCGGGAFIFHGVGPHVAGLVLAGTGGRSVGHALHRLLREVKKDGTLGDWKYTYQYWQAGERVEELRRMMYDWQESQR